MNNMDGVIRKSIKINYDSQKKQQKTSIPTLSQFYISIRQNKKNKNKTRYNMLENKNKSKYVNLF